MLGDAVELIAEKHVSLDIQPGQYLIVGECLLTAIKEVLGEAATDGILAEWKTAVFFLAGILIDVEKKKYDEQRAKEGDYGIFFLQLLLESCIILLIKTNKILI